MDIDQELIANEAICAAKESGDAQGVVLAVLTWTHVKNVKNQEQLLSLQKEAVTAQKEAVTVQKEAVQVQSRAVDAQRADAWWTKVI
eukprot:gene11422-13949_t